MRLPACVLGLLVVCLTIIPGLAATPTASPVAAPALNLVVIGDSIPFAGFCTECEHAFVDDYALRLGGALGREVNVFNRSRNDGAVLNQIADQVAGEGALRKQLASADLVIISAGMNDGPTWYAPHPCGSDIGTSVREAVEQILSYTPACLDAEVAAREDDFRRLFTEVDALAPEGTPVAVVNAYNWWSGWQDMMANGTPEELAQVDGSIAYFLDAWNAQECAIAAESGFICVDLYHAFNGPDGAAPAGDLLERDYSHPSKLGNALIADLLMAADLLGTGADTLTAAEATPAG